jgi:hypothetical protein
MYNERVLKDFDTQLTFLDSLGVSQTRKNIKRKEL